MVKRLTPVLLLLLVLFAFYWLLTEPRAMARFLEDTFSTAYDLAVRLFRSIIRFIEAF